MEHCAAVRRLVVVGGEVSSWGCAGPGQGWLAGATCSEGRGRARLRRRSTGQRGSERRGEDMGKPADTSWRSRARHGRNWRVPDNLLLQTQNYLYYGVHKINTNTTKQESIKEEILYRIRFLEN